MKAFAVRTLIESAVAAGLPHDRILEASESDNLTLPRPRLEYRFLPETYTRSGKRLALSRKDGVQLIKRELYVVVMDALATLFAPPELNDQSPENWGDGWLNRVCPAFVGALPRGGNDDAGNWVSIRAHKASLSKPLIKRVGLSEIRVMERLSALYQLRFTGRITAEEQQKLILDVTINPPAFTGKDL